MYLKPLQALLAELLATLTFDRFREVPVNGIMRQEGPMWTRHDCIPSRCVHAKGVLPGTSDPESGVAG